MEARKELFKVLKSGDFITVLDNKTVQIKDVKDVVTRIELPHSESIDFNKQTLLVEPSDQSFILFFNNSDSSTIVHFNRMQKNATWTVELPNTEVIYSTVLKNGCCILCRQDDKPLLFQYKNDRLIPLEQEVPFKNITQLIQLPDGNFVALSTEGSIFLLDSSFEKLKEVAIPDFSPLLSYRLFISPYGKVYVTSYLESHLQLSVFDTHDIRLDKTIKYDLSPKKKQFSDWKYDKFRYLTNRFLIANRYLVFIERENFCSDSLFPHRLWHFCETIPETTNYWLTIFDLANEQLLIKSDLITSITSSKYYRWGNPVPIPPGTPPPLPLDWLYFSALPDGRLVACHHIDKSSIRDEELRNQYQEFMMFDPLINECLRKEAVSALEQVTIPPLANIIADYAGFFAVKCNEYKDIPVEYTSKRDSCTIL